MIRLIPAVLAAVLAAGEPASVPVPASVPAPAPASAGPVWLGVNMDPNASSFDGGLPVIEVTPGSPAAAAGIQAGDRLVSIDGQTLAKPDDLRTRVVAAKSGTPFVVVLKRAGADLTLNGTWAERPRPPSMGEINRQLGDLERKLAEAKAAQPKELTLGEILQLLKEIEERLPKAAEEFKKQYPKGRFDIKISIEIVSDADAKDPLVISTQPATASPAK